MQLNEYQQAAVTTDLNPGPDGMIIALLGLAGEVGELLSEYKKHLRDGKAHQLFDERVAEELGDLLWYVASVSHRFGLTLDDIAAQNITKNNARWGVRTGHTTLVQELYDEQCPAGEQLPRSFKAQVHYPTGDGHHQVQLYLNGSALGDPLTDNAYDEDGYRFHDILHLAFAAVLGWSPVVRKLLEVKRKTDSLVDQVEDGGRATAIEEGIAALIFTHAKAHNFYEGIQEVDTELLQTIKHMTAHLEVQTQPFGQWEKAILAGFTIWRQVSKHQPGEIRANLKERSIVFRPDESVA
jgi:NTP pyrophosphatase (non-canonical NTP hydrolase)